MKRRVQEICMEHNCQSINADYSDSTPESTDRHPMKKQKKPCDKSMFSDNGSIGAGHSRVNKKRSFSIDITRIHSLPSAKTMESLSRNFRPSLAPVLILIVVGALLLPLYRFQINQDAITYISIAQKYVRGDWYNAINGHAYPLISWILAPFIICGIDPLLSSKIINLGIGAVILYTVAVFCSRLGLNRRLTVLCQLCILPGILYFAFTLITPDLLLSVILLFYHICALAPAYSKKMRYGFLCGLIGGIAYLAKNYSMPFFLCHFLLLNCFYYFKNTGLERKKIILAFASGLTIFLIICGTWSGIISMKYGKLTASNQGSSIMSVISPYRWAGPDHLIEPPNSTAVSIWEDPQGAFTGQQWSPFISRADFKYWLRHIERNLRIVLWSFFIFSPIGFCVCLWHATVTLRRPFLESAGSIIYIIVTCAIFASGYCLLVTDERLLWPLFFLFAILSILGLAELIKKSFFKNRVIYTGALLIFCLSFSVMPANMLYKNVNTGQEHALLGQKLSDVIAPGSKLVFDTKWYESLFLTFHLQSQIYGTADNIPTTKLADELQRCAIDYFILWQHTPDEYPFLNKASEIRANGLNELRIFKLTQQ
jgi:hypothetical protein